MIYKEYNGITRRYNRLLLTARQVEISIQNIYVAYHPANFVVDKENDDIVLAIIERYESRYLIRRYIAIKDETWI